MEWLTTLATAMGASWVAGYRLYACVAVLGVAGHFGWCRLPGQLEIMSDPRVFGVAAVLFLVEFFADKIAWLDTGWDAVHTFIRIPAGAIMASAAFADFDPWIKAVAFLIGGGIAFSAHGAKTATRVAVNHSPEPVSNVATSLTEDAVAGVSLAALIWIPVVMIAVVLAAVILTVWLFRKVKRYRASRV